MLIAASIVEALAIQGGALAILGWALWYLLTRALPQERESFLEALQATRQDFYRSLKTLAQSFDNLASAITGEPYYTDTGEEE